MIVARCTILYKSTSIHGAHATNFYCIKIKQQRKENCFFWDRYLLSKTEKNCLYFIDFLIQMGTSYLLVSTPYAYLKLFIYIAHVAVYTFQLRTYTCTTIQNNACIHIKKARAVFFSFFFGKILNYYTKFSIFFTDSTQKTSSG